MVVLTLTPYRGNHARSFPHAGFLGLTPVVIQGTVRTALEEDNKALKASELVVRVRCYETELGHRPKTRNGTGKATQVVYEQAQILWSKRSTDDWTELGDFQQAFRIVVPVDAVNAVSTSTFRNYRSWWQVEAVISHKPSTVHGSRKLASHSIPLVRYSLPPSALPAPALPTWAGISRHSDLAYEVTTVSSSSTPGPGETLAFAVNLKRDSRSPANGDFPQVKKVSLWMERHMAFEANSSACTSSSEDEDSRGSQSPPRHSSDFHPAGRAPVKGLSSVFKRASATTRHGRSPLSSPPCAPPPGQDVGSYFAAIPHAGSQAGPSGDSGRRSSISSMTMLSMDATEEEMVWNAQGAIRIRLSDAMPKTKSMYRYSVGETMKTRLMRITYAISGQIVLKHRSGTQEVIELDPRPLVVAGTSQAEREKALAHASRILAASESDSREHSSSSAVRSRSSSPPSHASEPLPTLGTRRTSNFMLTVETRPTWSTASAASSPVYQKHNDSLPSPAASSSSASLVAPRAVSIRRRSEQSDTPLGAPLKTRPRVGSPGASSMTDTASSEPSPGGPTPPASAGYILPEPSLYSASVETDLKVDTPPTPNSLEYRSTSLAGAVTSSPATTSSMPTTPKSSHEDAQYQQSRDYSRGFTSGDPFFPLASLTPHATGFPLPASPSSLSHHATGQQRSYRRNGRLPYSSLHRPRSAGQLSVISQRSNLSSQDGATSNASIRSIASVGTVSSSGTTTSVARDYDRETSLERSESPSSILALRNEMPSLSLIDNSFLPPLSPRQSRDPQYGQQQQLESQLLPQHAPQQLPMDNDVAGSNVLPVAAPGSPSMSDASTFSDSNSVVHPDDKRAITMATGDIDASNPEDTDDDWTEDPRTPPDHVLPLDSTLRDQRGCGAPSSPAIAIDFHAFSLAARQPVPMQTRAVGAGPDLVDPATRAEIAPWSVVEDDVSPFDNRQVMPGHTAQHARAKSGPPSTMSMSWSGAQAALPPLEIAPHHGPHGTVFGPRRKSAAAGGLFAGRVMVDDGPHDDSTLTTMTNASTSTTTTTTVGSTSGKEGGRWGFLRRGSRA